MRNGYVYSFLITIFNFTLMVSGIHQSFPAWAVAFLGFSFGVAITGTIYQYLIEKRIV